MFHLIHQWARPLVHRAKYEWRKNEYLLARMLNRYASRGVRLPRWLLVWVGYTLDLAVARRRKVNRAYFDREEYDILPEGSYSAYRTVQGALHLGLYHLPRNDPFYEAVLKQFYASPSKSLAAAVAEVWGGDLRPPPGVF